jgi:hypothetical protein
LALFCIDFGTYFSTFAVLWTHPAVLRPQGRPDLLGRLPEAESAVASGELGVDDQTVLVAQPDQELVYCSRFSKLPLREWRGGGSASNAFGAG